MKVVVFVCGEGEFVRYKGDPKTLGAVNYRECISGEPADATKVSHVFVLSSSFAHKDEIPNYGIRKTKTEELLKIYFSELLVFLQKRLGAEAILDDVTIITHWNFGAVPAMEEYVEEVRDRVANEEKGISRIRTWKSFSYSSTRKGFFPEWCDILSKDKNEVDVPSPKDCDEILDKLSRGYYKIRLYGDVKEMFKRVMAALNH